MEQIRKTIGSCLHERALSDPDVTALIMGDWKCSYGELDRTTDLLALRMKEKYGIGRGTHVGICGINSPNWVITFFAAARLGAVPVLINTCLKEAEILGILDQADVEVLCCGTGHNHDTYSEMIGHIKKENSRVRHFVSIRENEAGEWFSPASFPEQDGAGTISAEAADPEEAVCMIFTSGTSSRPKGVLLSHTSILTNARTMVAAMHWEKNDRMCIAVPMFHCFGITAGIIACMMCGAEMYLMPYFSTSAVWEALETGHCNILNGVPSMFLAMIRKEQYQNRTGKNVKSGIIAGSAIIPAEYAEICRRFPGMHLQPSYGQTETSPCVTIADWNDTPAEKSVSSGRPVDGVEVRIGGNDKAGGSSGEIQVRGYNVMLGYYHMPEEEKAAFTEDGWLKTGDTGYFNETGGLCVTGRLKEIIIRGGENISPREIEQEIERIPGVRSVKVIGVRADVLQEEIAACIIPEPGRHPNRDEVREYLRPRLAEYKIPGYVFEFGKYPMNASGKIDLEEMRKQAEERIKSIGAEKEAE